MNRPSIHAITEDDPAPTVAERIRALQAEAKQLAAEHMGDLLFKLHEVEALAKEIAEGGAVYHDGAQERARLIGVEVESQRKTLVQIMERVS